MMYSSPARAASKNRSRFILVFVIVPASVMIYPLGQTNPLRSQYIEVWATNATVFTNAIWQAHQQLINN